MSTITKTDFLAKHLISNFDKAATSFDDAAFLFSDINNRVIDRLEVIPLQPQRILDCGCGTGIGTQALIKQFKKAEVVSLDLSSKMLAEAKKKKKLLQKNLFICANAEHLPLKSDQFDFVYSNLMLHWCNDISKVFAEWQRILKSNGLLMFTALGPDTFKELRQVLDEVNPKQVSHSFIDMHDLGDVLLKQHLLEPVLDVETFQINYSSVDKLLTDLHNVGGRNLNPQRIKNLFGKKYFSRFKQALEVLKTNEGKIPLTVEVVYGHAWGSDLQGNINRGNAIEVPLHLIKR